MVSYSKLNNLKFDWEGLLRRIGKYTWLIVLATVFGGTLMCSIGKKVTPPRYVASTRIIVLKETWDEELEVYDLNVSTHMRYDYAKMVYSRSVIEAVIEKLEWDTTYEKVRRYVYVSGKDNSRILDIIVLDTNPERARMLANMIREETYHFMKETLNIVDVTMNVVDDGYVWDERYSVIRKYWLIPGATGGFRITTAVIIIMYFLEDSVRKAEDIEKRLKLSVLGCIPKYTESNKQEVAEAYNVIRTNMEFTGENIKTIAITSTIPNDSGTYGRVENYVQNKIKKMTAEKGTSVRMGKLLYFKDRIFPNRKWWEENYPICKGRYYLIPFCWVYRMIVKTCTNGSKAIREIKAAL